MLLRFHCLFNFRVSIFFRPYSFWWILFEMLIQGNVEMFTFLAFHTPLIRCDAFFRMPAFRATEAAPGAVVAVPIAFATLSAAEWDDLL